MLKITALIFAILLLMLSPQGASSAGVTLSPASGVRSSTFVIAGSGYGANQWVELRWDNQPFAFPYVQADAQGSFTATRSVPSSASFGQHYVSALSLTV